MVAKTVPETKQFPDVEIVLHAIPTPDSRPYIIVSGPDGHVIVAVPDGRLFFSAYDAGAIGEVIPRPGR